MEEVDPLPANCIQHIAMPRQPTHCRTPSTNRTSTCRTGGRRGGRTSTAYGQRPARRLGSRNLVHSRRKTPGSRCRPCSLFGCQHGRKNAPPTSRRGCLLSKPGNKTSGRSHRCRSRELSHHNSGTCPAGSRKACTGHRRSAPWCHTARGCCTARCSSRGKCTQSRCLGRTQSTLPCNSPKELCWRNSQLNREGAALRRSPPPKKPTLQHQTSKPSATSDAMLSESAGSC